MLYSKSCQRVAKRDASNFLIAVTHNREFYAECKKIFPLYTLTIHSRKLL